MHKQTVYIMIRVKPDLRDEVKALAKKYGSSINRFCEVALEEYRDNLKAWEKNK